MPENMLTVFSMRGRYLLCCVAFAGNGAAWAAPWTQDDGGIYLRGAYANETLNGVGADRADVYGEYGLTRNWTVTAKAEAVTYNGPDDILDSESYRLTTRRAVWRHEGWVAGAVSGALCGAAGAGGVWCESAGGEVGQGGGE